MYQKIFTNTGNAYDPNTGNLCHSYFYMLIVHCDYGYSSNKRHFFTVTKLVCLCISQVNSQHQWMESISSDFMLMLTLSPKWQSVSIKTIRSNALYFLWSPRAMLMAAMVLFSRCRRVKCTHSCGRTAGFSTMKAAIPVSAVFCFSPRECPQNPELDVTKRFLCHLCCNNNICVKFASKEESIVWSSTLLEFLTW